MAEKPIDTGCGLPSQFPHSATTINPQSTTLISTGGTDPNGAVLPFAFVGGHTNMLFLDRLGNLWIGDDTSDGHLNFSGRIWYISAGALASIP